MLSLTYLLNFSIKLYLLMNLISVCQFTIVCEVICERHRHACLFMFFFVFCSVNLILSATQYKSKNWPLCIVSSLAHAKSTKICVREYPPLSYESDNLTISRDCKLSLDAVNLFMLKINLKSFFFLIQKLNPNVFVFFIHAKHWKKWLFFVCLLFNPRMVNVWYIKFFLSSILLRLWMLGFNAL